MPPVPKWTVFGRRLTAARGSESLAAVAARVGVAIATLHQWEAGARVLPKYAARVDAALGGDRLLEAEIYRLNQGRWDPQISEVSGHHVHRWPVAHDGQVWVWVRPAEGSVGGLHQLTLRWGRWTRHVTVTLGGAGMTLLTGKAEDHSDPACELQVTPAAYALFGINAPQHGPVMDIRDLWQEHRGAQ